MAGCHDKLGVPGTERGPAGGAVAAVGRAAAARAERDIGAAQPTPAARLPRNPCVETENRSEVKSQVSVYLELWRLDPALIMDGGSED